MVSGFFALVHLHGPLFTAARVAFDLLAVQGRIHTGIVTATVGASWKHAKDAVL